MKKFEQGKTLFSGLIIFTDIILFNISYFIAIMLRDLILENLEEIQMFDETYLQILLILNIVTIFFFIITKSYQFRSPFFSVDEIPFVFKGIFGSFIAISILLVWIQKAHTVSRLIIVFWGVLSFILISLSRIYIRKIEVRLLYKIFGLKNALIIGLNESGFAIRDKIIKYPGQGYKFIGFLSERATHIFNAQILGTVYDLEETLKSQDIEEVFIASTEMADKRKIEIIRVCEKNNVIVTIVSDLMNIIAGQMTITEIYGIPIMMIKRSPLHGLNLFTKKLMDFFGSMFLISIFSPLLLILSILIKLDSKGPVFFKQLRVGKDGAEFYCFKFRSMVDDAERMVDDLKELDTATGPIFKIKNDPRITRIGKFLRRTSLDELPQLFNVIKGEMSLVGPRPPIPSEVNRYGVNELKRLEINQGMTGLWQVSGRSELSFEDMVKLDIYYIENWSLWLDIKILLKTIPVVLKAKGAY